MQVMKLILMSIVTTINARMGIKATINKSVYLLLTLWTNVINIGLYDHLPSWKLKRTRLVNAISFIAILINGSVALNYTDSPHRTTFFESIVPAFFYCIPILFNLNRKYTASVLFFNLFSTAVYTFYAISHGKVDAAEYLLVSSSIGSMLFFNDFRIILFFFLLNFGCFWLCKYSFTIIKPFLFMPGNENFYVMNHIFTFSALFIMVYYFKLESIKQEKLLIKQRDALEREKRISEDLLLNILPYDTAEELKQTGTAKAKSFDMVTVMFTDFKNFTTSTEALEPAQLVAEVNYCYCAFDNIISKYNIEKIKTIGDSYMCAGGLPKANNSNAHDVIMAALEIQEFMHKWRQEKELRNELFYELRIGVHSGPVVAGIVGLKKFAYDIWGDTVNVASCMESSGEVGKINISEITYGYINKHFKCSYRGKIPAKHKGFLSMYFVDGPVS